jgi:diguanylate cyclase (GGDEF)-like protein
MPDRTSPSSPPDGSLGRGLRLRLALYFVILALIPLGVVTWVLNRSTVHSEADKVDTRLIGVAQSARLEFGAAVRQAQRRAKSLALDATTRDDLVSLVGGEKDAAVLVDGRVLAGSVSSPALLRSARRYVNGKLIGTVVVSVPYDRSLTKLLSAAAALGPDDVLALERDGTIVAGPKGLAGQTLAVNGPRATVDGSSFRVRVVPLVTGPTRVSLVALTPQADIDSAVSRFRAELLLAVAASLITVALLAYLLGQPILRSLGELSQVARLADRDELTDLANRRGFREALDAELQRAERFGGSVTLILADLDDFKQINDRFGHQVGDDVLKLFADVLREGARAIDVPARIGGEEFAVVLPETDLAGGEQLAERLRSSLASRSIPLRGRESISVTASFGVASYPEAGSEADLQAAADAALYRVKASGKNSVATAGAPVSGEA